MTHQVTDENRKLVENASAYGLSQETISKLVNVTGKTLRRKYRTELDAGMAKAHFNVGRTTYEQAISGKNPTMTIWYEKTRMGMRETVQMTTPPGEPFQGQPGEPEMIGAYFERLARAATEADSAARAGAGAAAPVGEGGQGTPGPEGGAAPHRG